MVFWRTRVIIGLLSIVAVGLFWLDAEPRTRALLLTTLKLCFTVMAVSVPVGATLAVLLSRTDVFGKRIFQTILTTMLFVPLYLQAAGWDAGFGRQGWLSLANEGLAQPWLSGFRAAMWIHCLAAIPWAALLIGIALRHIDPELEESASLDHSKVSILLRVTLPFAAPAIAVAALWVSILTAGEATVTDLYQVRTYAEEVYTMTQLLDESLDQESGGASLPQGIGVLSLLLVAGLLMAVTILRQPIGAPVRPPLLFPLGGWRLPATILVAIVVLMIAGVPLANLFYNAGMQVEANGGDLERHWSAAKASSMVFLAPQRFFSELRWSAAIGATSATLCLALAVPLAWFGRRGRWRVLPALAAVAVGAAVPGPVLGLWIIRMLNWPDLAWLAWLYDHTILAPVLATTIRALPAAILVVWYGIQSLPSDLLDAAAVDGLTPIGRMLRVVIPIRSRALSAAWLCSLIVAAGELSASILVTPPGLFTIPVRVFGLLHAGVDDQVAGLCLANIGVMLLIQLGFARTFPRSDQ